MQRLDPGSPTIIEKTEAKEGYRRMANDIEHEREAEEWCEGLIGDAFMIETNE